MAKAFIVVVFALLPVLSMVNGNEELYLGNVQRENLPSSGSDSTTLWNNDSEYLLQKNIKKSKKPIFSKSSALNFDKLYLATEATSSNDSSIREIRSSKIDIEVTEEIHTTPYPITEYIGTVPDNSEKLPTFPDANLSQQKSSADAIFKTEYPAIDDRTISIGDNDHDVLSEKSMSNTPSSDAAVLTSLPQGGVSAATELASLEVELRKSEAEGVEEATDDPVNESIERGERIIPGIDVSEQPRHQVKKEGYLRSAGVEDATVVEKLASSERAESSASELAEPRPNEVSHSGIVASAAASADSRDEASVDGVPGESVASGPLDSTPRTGRTDRVEAVANPDTGKTADVELARAFEDATTPRESDAIRHFITSSVAEFEQHPETITIPNSQIVETGRHYDFVVANEFTEIPCTLASMNLMLKVSYGTTNGTINVVEMRVPADAVATGSCKTVDSHMKLAWVKGSPSEENSVTFRFAKDGTSFSVSHLQVRIILDNEDFPNAAEVILAGSSSDNLGLFAASAENEMHVCSSVTEISCGNIVALIKDVFLIVYNENKTVSNRKEKQCAVKEPLSATAIAGGVAGAAVAMGLVASYLWHKKRINTFRSELP